MADPRRNQEYLGIDSNVVLAYLIPDHPDHRKTQVLVGSLHVVNPTVIHETYHTSVFKLRRNPSETARVLLDYVDLALCLPIDTLTAKRGLRLAARHSLGGRDALILASYLLSKKVRRFVTFDKSLLALGEVRAGARILPIVSPTEL